MQAVQTPRMYPAVNSAQTALTIATAQVYAQKASKSPSGDTARLPSMRRVSVP